MTTTPEALRELATVHYLRSYKVPKLLRLQILEAADTIENLQREVTRLTALVGVMAHLADRDND